MNGLHCAGRRLRWVLLLVSLVSTAGCTWSFRDGLLQETRPWPPVPRDPSVRKPVASLSLVVESVENGERKPGPPVPLDPWYRLAEDVYLASGLFSRITPEEGGTDLVVRIVVVHDWNYSKFLALLWGCSLGIIPACGEDIYTWRTTFSDPAGQVRGVIEKKESSVTWVNLLLMVVPWEKELSVRKEIMDDLNRSTLLDALELEYLKP